MSGVGAHTWVACANLTCAIDWLDHWQTLIAGTGAIVAAGVSILYLRKQIAEASAQETRKRARRLAATRSRLQTALSEVSDYASETIELLKAYLDAPASGRGALGQRPRPPFPDAALRALEDMIEATDDDAFAGFISDFVAELQVLDSNLRFIGSNSRASLGPNLVSLTTRAAKAHAYADTMFPYARREACDPPQRLDWQRVVGALTLNLMVAERYPELHDFVGRARRRAEGDRS